MIAVAAPEEAGVPPRSKKIQFEVERKHSRTLAPGISIGIDDTDVIGQQVKGWMWIMPDRRYDLVAQSANSRSIDLLWSRRWQET